MLTLVVILTFPVILTCLAGRRDEAEDPVHHSPTAGRNEVPVAVA